MKLKMHHTLAYFLILSLLLSPTLAASPFPDVSENADYVDAAAFMKDIGIMQGDDRGNFNPDKAVTRGEMAAIICRALDETNDLVEYDMFSDVPKTNWANKYITRAAELGIVQGYDDRNFGPADTVTYEQALAMLIRGIGLENMAMDLGGFPNGYIAIADDYGYSKNLSASIGSPLKRGQVAVILYNMLAWEA